MKSRWMTSTRRLVAVVHHRLVRFSSFLCGCLDEGFSVFSLCIDDAKDHKAREAYRKTDEKQEIKHLENSIRDAAACFGIILHLHDDGMSCGTRS